MLQKIKDSVETNGWKITLRLVKSTILKKINSRVSYSQYGEDLIIDKLLNLKDKGFYIDVGAFDPESLNNTKLFFDRGWKGINIDPNPDTIRKFNEKRPSDTNLNFGIANKEGTLKAVLFENCKSYTLSEKLIKQHEQEQTKVINSINIPVKTLKSIFTEYVKDVKVDFISIDTEGLDLQVLEGNDWEKYRPKVICVETYNEQGENIDYRQRIHNFMEKIKYKLAYDTGLNSILIDTRN